MKPRIAIHIPVYNQPDKLEYCLASIRNQTLLPDEIVLFDDCSSESYKDVVEKYKNLNIKYIRNKSNLGAVPNMLNALYFFTDADYINVFHEDDIMESEFIRLSVHALEQNPLCAFSISPISFFQNYGNTQKQLSDISECEICCKKDLIISFLKGRTLGFGTVFYRRKSLVRADFDFKSYGVFGDRSFLLKIAGDNPVIVFLKELVLVYDHSLEKDNRWKTLKLEHIFNLYDFYLKELSLKLSQADKVVKAGVTHGVVSACKMFSLENSPGMFYCIIKAYSRGLLSIKYYLLLSRYVRKSVEFIRKYLCV